MAMYNSFYGGRRGASFILRNSYPTIQDMLADFHDPNTTDKIGFDEYTIISNENRSWPENGRIFRRGYDYNDQTRKIQKWDSQEKKFVDTDYSYGAELVGSIVGPPSPAPNIKMAPFANIGTTISQEAEYSNMDVLEASQGQMTIVPGKDGSTYNDDIKYYAATMRSEDNEESVVYIGFQVPYLVTEFEGELKEPGYNGPAVSSVNVGNHPFYKKWKINVPRGVQGDQIDQLLVTTWATRPGQNDSNIKYYYYDENYNKQEITGSTNLFKSDESIIIYKKVNYDEVYATSKIEYYYLSKCREIKSITVNQGAGSDSGAITFNFTAGESITLTRKLTWITGVGIDQDNGKLNLYLNTGESVATSNGSFPFVKDMRYQNGNIDYQRAGHTTWENLTHLTYVNDINQGSNGNLTLKYNDETPDKTIPIKSIERIGWVTTLDISRYDGLTDGDKDKLFIAYKDNTVDLLSQAPFYVIDQFDYDKIHGTLTIKKSNESIATIHQLEYPTDIKYNIRTAELSQDFITGENKVIGGIPLLKKMEVGTNKYLYAQYNVSGNAPEVQEIINSYQAYNVYESGHAKNNGWVNVGYVGYTPNPLTVEYDYNYANLKDAILNHGVPAGDPYENDYASISDQMDFNRLTLVVAHGLNLLYEDGLGGKVITVGDTSAQKDFYAYGNNGGTNPSWFYLGRIEQSKISIGTNSGSTSEDGILLIKDEDVCNITYDITGNCTPIHRISQIKKGSIYRNRFTVQSQPIGSVAEYIFAGSSVSNTLPLNRTVEIQVTNDMTIHINLEP